MGDLEYTLCAAHIGKRKIRQTWDHLHWDNDVWSYAEHTIRGNPSRDNTSRTNVAAELLVNLHNTPDGAEMDLSPLLLDQRVSGFVYGSNPLQAMYNVIGEFAKRNPGQEFEMKWGGWQSWKPGKRFVFYIVDEEESQKIISPLLEVAGALNVPLEASHQYGVTDYQDFVRIDEHLRSPVADTHGFAKLLAHYAGFEHFKI